jgi:hypothetical protein
MRRALLASVSVVAAGCATVAPMQTASVVEEGGWRAGGQLSFGYCDVEFCNDYPDGIPLPELRLDLRRGVGSHFDFGASFQLQPMIFAVERVLQAGLTVDVKRELLHLGDAELAHVLSAEISLAGAWAGRLGISPALQGEAGAHLFYGLQAGNVEVVVSGWAAWRTVWPSAAQPSSLLHSARFGASAGVFSRNPAGWAIQLGYNTERTMPHGGLIQLQAGWFWDIP